MKDMIYIHHFPEARKKHADPTKDRGWHPANCWCEPTVSHKIDMNGEPYINVYHQRIQRKRVK